MCTPKMYFQCRFLEHRRKLLLDFHLLPYYLIPDLSTIPMLYRVSQRYIIL